MKQQEQHKALFLAMNILKGITNDKIVLKGAEGLKESHLILAVSEKEYKSIVKSMKQFEKESGMMKTTLKYKKGGKSKIEIEIFDKKVSDDGTTTQGDEEIVVTQYKNQIASLDGQKKVWDKMPSCRCWMGNCHCGYEEIRTRFNIASLRKDSKFGIYIQGGDGLRMITNDELDRMEIYLEQVK